jgi:DNA-directed RNA polymerase specialized sigma24 family protein
VASVTRPAFGARLDSADVNDLLARARQADRDAFGELFRRFRRYAEAVARSCGAGDPEEAAAESFRLVVSAIESGSGPTVAFGPYLATTVRSVARRQRQLAARQEIVEPTTFDAVGVDESTAMPDPVLATAFASLPERWQSVIWYVDVEGMRPRQVVDLVEVPSSNAASALLLRARAGLRVAYLEALVGEAHTPEVRAHLAGLVAGAATADELDLAAQWHLERCPECRELQSRVSAIVGRQPSRQLAIAVVALMGFVPEADLIPTGAGLAVGGGLSSLAGTQTGWLTAAATTVVVGGVLTVAALMGGGSDRAGDRAGGLATVETVSATPPRTDRSIAPVSLRPVPSTTSTTAPSTTSTTTSSSTSLPALTSAPPTVAVTVPPATPAPPEPTVAGTAAPEPTATDVAPTDPAPTTTPEATAPATSPSTVPTTNPPPETTSTTVAPDRPVGALAGQWSVVNEELLHVDVVVNELTGDSGRIVFSAPMAFTSVSGATCATTECTFAGVASPATISIAADTDVTAITIQLFDAAGNVDDTANAG